MGNCGPPVIPSLAYLSDCAGAVDVGIRNRVTLGKFCTPAVSSVLIVLNVATIGKSLQKRLERGEYPAPRYSAKKWVDNLRILHLV